MIKVLLVDDEILVRTNIKLMLQDFSDRICICGEASNGQEALSLIPRLQPDVILSDMMMPIMNGVVLCEQVHKNFPDIAFIALSNYDDFEFVRGTLKSGGIDYLLKHTLDAKTLSPILLKLDKKDQNAAKTISYSENSINALREKFVLDLFGRMFYTRDDILYHLNALYIRLDVTQVQPLLMRIDNYAQLLDKQDANKRRIVEFSIINIGNEILNQYQTGILTHLDNEFYCILLSYANIHSELKRKEITNSLIRQLSSNLKTYLNITTSYSIGKICEKIEEISESYLNARQNMMDSFYLGSECIIAESISSNQFEPLKGLSMQEEKEIVSAIIANDKALVLDHLNQLFDTIEKRQRSPQNTKMVFSDLIGILTRICKEKNIPMDSIFKEKLPPMELVSKLSTIHQVYQWFFSAYDALFAQLASLSMGDSSYVQHAVAYIHANYSKPISLQSTAEEIGISHGYLSKIFKSETKQGFSDYLNSFRISNATKLLDYGEEDLHKISIACSFQDYAYFFRVFKKKTGITPTVYRRKKG